MLTYADVEARWARIVTGLEAIATDANATPADPRDLFIRLELLSYELQGATVRVPIVSAIGAGDRHWSDRVLRNNRHCDKFDLNEPIIRWMFEVVL
jgi:hypothetical protein